MQSTEPFAADSANELSLGEGTAIASLSGDVGLLDGSRSQPSRTTAGGFTFQIVGRYKTWPVMIGLGGGLLSFWSSRQDGPTVVRIDADGLLGTSTTVTRGLELRHAELLLRVEPFWGMVRPFVEGAFGLAVMWRTARLDDALGRSIVSDDEQHGVGALFGISAGIDWRLWSSGKGASGAWDLVLTTGVRRWYTTALPMPEYRADERNQVLSESARIALGMWTPFIAISLSIDSRPEARGSPHDIEQRSAF